MLSLVIFSLDRWILRPLLSVTLAAMAALSLSRGWQLTPGLAAAGKIALLLGADAVFLLLTGVITLKQLIRLTKKLLDGQGHSGIRKQAV